jgi:integrase
VSASTKCAPRWVRAAGVPLNIIQRQLGHANLGTTSIYLQRIDPEEIIAAVHTRRAPMMSATAGLRL